MDGADIMFSKQTAYSEVECWHGSPAIPVGFLVYIYSLCEFCMFDVLVAIPILCSINMP